MWLAVAELACCLSMSKTLTVDPSVLPFDCEMLYVGKGWTIVLCVLNLAYLSNKHFLSVYVVHVS